MNILGYEDIKDTLLNWTVLLFDLHQDPYFVYLSSGSSGEIDRISH